MNQQTTVSDLWRQLGATPTLTASWLDLARAYAAEGLPWQAGYTARQALRLDPGLLPGLQSLALGPWQNAALGDALLGRANLPEAAALAERFALQVQACAGDWLSWLYLARLQEIPASDAVPKLDQQGDALQQAISLEPIPGESLHWMGVWRLNAGDAAGAVAALAGLLDIRPVRFGSMMMLLLTCCLKPVSTSRHCRSGSTSGSTRKITRTRHCFKTSPAKDFDCEQSINSRCLDGKS